MGQQATPNLECSMGKLDKNTTGPLLAPVSCPTKRTQIHPGQESKVRSEDEWSAVAM